MNDATGVHDANRVAANGNVVGERDGQGACINIADAVDDAALDIDDLNRRARLNVHDYEGWI